MEERRSTAASTVRGWRSAMNFGLTQKSLAPWGAFAKACDRAIGKPMGPLPALSSLNPARPLVPAGSALISSRAGRSLFPSPKGRYQSCYAASCVFAASVHKTAHADVHDDPQRYKDEQDRRTAITHKR